MKVWLVVSDYGYGNRSEPYAVFDDRKLVDAFMAGAMLESGSMKLYEYEINEISTRNKEVKYVTS